MKFFKDSQLEAEGYDFNTTSYDNLATVWKPKCYLKNSISLLLQVEYFENLNRYRSWKLSFAKYWKFKENNLWTVPLRDIVLDKDSQLEEER